MTSKNGTRFSKHQAGMEVTPIVENKRKKSKQPAQKEDDDISEKVYETEKNICEEEEHSEEYESEEDNAFEEGEDGEALQHEEVEETDLSHHQVEEMVNHPTQHDSLSSQEVQTQQSETKKRKTRGPTRMRKVAKHHDDKVEVEFTSVGEHVGCGSVTLSSFLGPLVREHVPVLLKDWRKLDAEMRDTLWEEIQVIIISILHLVV